MRSDEELLAAWARDDRDAGRELYQRYAPRVTAFFARKTDDDLPDLVQRTFLKLLESTRRGATIGNLGGFLFAIARNELYDQLARRSGARDRFSPVHTSLAELRTGVSTRLVRRREEQLLHDALAKLPLDAQLALELYYWEDLAMADIARILETTASAAINRIHRARAQLRELLAPELADALDTKPLP